MNRATTNEIARPTATPPSASHRPRDDEAEHGGPIGADGHADADFACALADQVGEHAVNADRGKRERERREEAEQQSREARRGCSARNDIGHRPDRGNRQIRVHRQHFVSHGAHQ